MTSLTGGGAPPQKSMLAKADEWLGKIETALDFIAAFFILGLMFLGVVNVVGRRLFDHPVAGYIDIVEVTMVAYAFLGVAFCQRVGGHVRMEILVQRLKGRALWIAEAVAVLIGVIVIAVLIWYGFEHALRAYRLGDSTIDLRLPVWPAKLVVPVAFAVLWLRLLIQFLGYARLAVDPGKQPIAVPLIEDAREHARHEIEELLVDENGQDDGGRQKEGAAHG